MRSAKFRLTAPKLIDYKSYELNGSTLGVTMCILPGQDPCNQVKKQCQDGVFVTEADGTFFAALFDGHGTGGEEVVEFCLAYLKKFFKEHRQHFDANPTASIEQAIKSCDDALDRCSDIDSNLAGTTAVVLYINAAGIHVGSVGDSRAVLGTSSGAPLETKVSSSSTTTNFNCYRRLIENVPHISAIPLSTDHKPNHEGEMERILQAGGKVARLMDENGNRVGPYRVWNAIGRLPGLAMSRSIGDRLAHSVGVSAEPVVQTFSFDVNDKFIVIASDGVWDVLDNKDVANLVETFRHKCARGILHNLPRRVRPDDIYIAHLVALESRLRWFDIVQEEDVMIDDISVIVIELKDISALTPVLTQRLSTVKQSMAIAEETKQLVNGLPQRSKDPIRGSTAVMSPPRHSVSRNDKVRGSVVLNEDMREMLEETVEEVRHTK
jgi:serine/threonine protein phosphatase PrpC